MFGYPNPDTTAQELQRCPLDEARRRLKEILAEPWRHRYTDAGMFAAGLSHNAKLVTRLRERGVQVWGTD